jgi:hypothetical protein
MSLGCAVAVIHDEKKRCEKQDILRTPTTTKIMAQSLFAVEGLRWFHNNCLRSHFLTII